MKKSLILILIATIIAGLILIFTVGFNYDILTKKHQQIELNIGEEYNNKELKKLVEDVIGAEAEIQKKGDFEDQAVISAKEIPTDKISEIVTKVNEKYGKELTADSVQVKEIPQTKLTDFLMPYIWSFAISTILILVYLLIRYKKQGIAKILLKTLGFLAMIELFTFSIIALFRMPVGINLPSIVFGVYTIGILGITICFEKKYQKIKLEEKNKKEDKKI